MSGRWLIAALLTLSACKDDAFFCTDDAQCMEAGAAGMCQPNDLCSFPSDDCPSGQVYGKYSGTLAGRCVREDDTVSSSTAGGTEPTPTEPTGPTSSPTSDATTTGSLTFGTSSDATTTEAGESSSASTSSSTGSDGPPNGSACMTDDECASGACYPSILGSSVCGECLSDADCEFGCTPPHPLNPSQQWALCNDGDLGDSCENSRACTSAELQCVSFANIGGIFSISTCSECETSADCPGAMLCNEFFNAGDLRGGFACVNPGSLFDGSFCTVGAVGEAACMSLCSPGSYMNLFNFGVCSPCASDADCGPGMVCQPPELDLDAGTSTTAACQ